MKVTEAHKLIKEKIKAIENRSVAIDSEYTDEITCPHCGFVGMDSWERSSDEGTDQCEECESHFVYNRHIEITYNTQPVVHVLCDICNRLKPLGEWQIRQFVEKKEDYTCSRCESIKSMERLKAKKTTCKVCSQPSNECHCVEGPER